MRGKARLDGHMRAVHFQHAAVRMPRHRRQIRGFKAACAGYRHAMRLGQRHDAQHRADAAAEGCVGLQDIQRARRQHITKPRHRLNHLPRRQRNVDRAA